MTNSLAANNQFAVHGGYAPSRKPLLRSGIRVHEMRPYAAKNERKVVAATGAKATLHTKAYLIEDRELFIGSFNFDPRSAFLNTESGVIIRSPAMTRRLTDAIDMALAENTYGEYL